MSKTKADMQAPENKLFYGDNLEVLRKYIKDETVDLCYIDPPFNSKRNYNQIYNNIGKEDQAQAQAFIDTWTWDNAAEKGIGEIIANTGGVFTVQSIELIIGLQKVLGKGALLSYLVSMTLRIAEIYRVLKPTGSFYLHCDPTASHYLKIIIDAIFCSRKGEYLNEIIWQRINAKGNVQKKFGAVHDVIFRYSKISGNEIWNQPYAPLSKEYVELFYNYIEENTGRRYTLSDLTAPIVRASKGQIYKWKNVELPPSRCWVYAKDKMEELDSNGQIVHTKNGMPRLKRYLDVNKGEKVTDTWTDIPQISSHEYLGYPTQKPETLLKRIIMASSNEGDTVLDAYCGCGTTIAVAEHLNRKWIGIDITYQSVSLMLKRLEDSFGSSVFDNVELNGVPRDLNSAIALANKKEDKTRKEFEKWAVLTYSNNRAAINEAKGGDGGIDGTAFIMDMDAKNKQEHKKVLFSVKSNKTLSPTVIRDLNGTMERDGAALAFLITLYPMDNLVKESKKYGVYHNKLFGHDYPKIEVISIEEMLQGKRMNLPSAQEVVKKAKKKTENSKQGLLDL